MRAVSDLRRIDVAGDDERAKGLGCELDAVQSFKRLNVALGSLAAR